MVKKKENLFTRMRNKRIKKAAFAEERDRLVGKIISGRNFDVPTHFIQRFLTDGVIDFISGDTLGHRYNIARYSSTAMMKSELDAHTISNYKLFMKNVRKFMSDGSIHMDFTRTALLKNINTPMAALTLLTKTEWKAFLKKKKVQSESEFSFGLYLSYLIHTMMDLDCEVPTAVIDEILGKTWKLTITPQCGAPVGLFNLSEIDYVIKQADAKRRLNYDSVELVMYYWRCGGTYFPECDNFIESMMYFSSDYNGSEKYLKYIEAYDNSVKKNNVPHSYGYYLFKYLCMLREAVRHNGAIYHIFFGLSNDPFYVLGVNDAIREIKKCEPEIVRELLEDLLRYDAFLDANTIDYIFKLPIKSSVTRVLDNAYEVKTNLADTNCLGECTWLYVVESCISSSITPLRDMTIHRKLFGERIPHRKTQTVFIQRGGNPSTIKNAGTPDQSNVCYTLDGIKLILESSTDDDIIAMFDDELFVDKIAAQLLSPNVTGSFTSSELTKLLNIIMRLEYIPDNIKTMTDYAIRRIGTSNMPNSCVGYYAQKPEIKTNYAAINDMIRVRGLTCIGKIPVHLLPKDVVTRCILYTGGGSGFFKLDTVHGITLDHILTANDLVDVLLTRKIYEYIPDLSYENVQRYMDMAIKKRMS